MKLLTSEQRGFLKWVRRYIQITGGQEIQIEKSLQDGYEPNGHRSRTFNNWRMEHMVMYLQTKDDLD